MSADSRTFLDRVRATIAEHQMLSPDDRVLVGVSGGPDSMALFHALIALGYDAVAAHLDHSTRDGASAEDAAFVQSQSLMLDRSFFSERIDVTERAQSSNDSFEATARRMRYEFFARAAAEHACVAIATGHHADDQAETVLLRLLRGASPEGLGGIPPVRPLDGLRVIRPMIDCTRAEVMAYLSEAGFAFREDVTNADASIPRNRVRHELLPLLKRDFNPRVSGALVRLAGMARDDNRVLELEAERFARESMTAQSIDRRVFSNGFASLQRRVIVAFAHMLGVSMPFERVEAVREFVARGKTGTRIELGDGVTIVNTRDTTSRYEAPDATAVPVTIPVPGHAAAMGRRFEIVIKNTAPAEPLREYCTPQRQVFDADAMGTSLIVRSRRPGDRFTPLGMTGERKVQDYFVDLGVPKNERDHVPIVETEGRIVWIVGGAMDAHFALTETTRAFVEMEVTDAAE